MPSPRTPSTPPSRPSSPGPALADLSFNAWAAQVFAPAGSPAPRPARYSPDMSAADAETVVLYMTQLFEQPVALLDMLEDDILADGFRYLAWGSGYLRALGDSRVELRARLRCLGAVGRLMGTLFVVRCSHHLSYRGVNRLASPLNRAALDLWEAVYAHLPKDEGIGAILNREALKTLEGVLYLPSIACQEGALYGLSQWRHVRPQEVQHIIARFLVKLPHEADAVAELGDAILDGTFF